jgi:hypothetical protein
MAQLAKRDEDESLYAAKWSANYAGRSPDRKAMPMVQ